MITIHTKTHKFEYYGNIEIYYSDFFLCIDWWANDSRPPINEDELFTWCSNGFDRFFIADIINIIGE